MPVRRPVAPTRTAALLATAALTLTGCGSDASSGSGSGPTPGPPTSGSTSAAPSSPTASSSSAPSGGSSDHPVVLQPSTDLLDWRAVPGTTRDVVTVGDDWTLTVPAGGASARLQGARPVTIRTADHFTITDAFLDSTRALVVSEDRLAVDPDRAVLVDLASGRRRTLDGGSTPPTSVGGTWALGPDTLAHATTGTAGAYCVTWLALGSLGPEGRYCVPPRNGLSRASITADGATLMRFDAHRPSCRTLLMRSGSRTTALPGVTPCTGWDSALLPGGAVWSVIPNERRVEVAHVVAHTTAGWFDLGRGTSGSLATCAGAAYFVRDPETRQDPATLLRWDPATAMLATVFASQGHGNAFLSPPRCGGDHLTVTAFSAAGDQQVTTRVGAP